MASSNGDGCALAIVGFFGGATIMFIAMVQLFVWIDWPQQIVDRGHAHYVATPQGDAVFTWNDPCGPVAEATP